MNGYGEQRNVIMVIHNEIQYESTYAKVHDPPHHLS